MIGSSWFGNLFPNFNLTFHTTPQKENFNVKWVKNNQSDLLKDLRSTQTDFHGFWIKTKLSCTIQYTTSTNRSLVLARGPGYELGVKESISVFVYILDLRVAVLNLEYLKSFTRDFQRFICHLWPAILGTAFLKALASTKLWWATRSIISSPPVAIEHESGRTKKLSASPWLESKWLEGRTRGESIHCH